MKILVFLLVLLAIDLPDVNKIAKINKIKDEATVAYNKKMYNVAVNRYKTLITELGVEDEKVKLNLGHAYYQMQDTVNAYKQYSDLTAAKDKDIRSIAHLQIGNLRVKAQDLETALLHYKSALKAAPNNESARTNYELIKKLLEQKKQQQSQNQEQKQQDKSEEDKKDDQKQQEQKKEEDKKQHDKKQQEQQKESQGGEKKDDNGEKKQAERDDSSKEKGKEKEKDKTELRAERLEQMNLTEDRAKMILDAMKSSEVQYLQQSQKKPSKKADKTKPDW